MNEFRLSYLLNALLFAAIGIVALLVAALLLRRLLPGDLHRELIEKQNVALAIVAAAGLLSVAWIISAAVH